MRAFLSWPAAFLILFAAYQLPGWLGSSTSSPPALASAAMLAFLPIAWLVARLLGRGMGAAYALEWSRAAAGWLAIGFALALAAKTAGLLIGLQLGVYVTEVAPPRHGALTVLASLAWGAVFTFFPSIAEDIVTRGFWLRVPRWPWTSVRFVVFSAAAYVLNHIYRLSHGPSEWLMLFCFGLAYATALWRTGSLWAALGLHWGWNFANAALDVLWPTDLVNVGSSRLISAAMHLLLWVIVALGYAPSGKARDHEHAR